MLERVPKKQLLERVKDLFDDAVSYDREWQNTAKESFEFRDTYGQWDKFEKDILEEERRPALTFNVTKSHIDLIKGLNEDIKKRWVCSPVSTDDSFLCEVLNSVIYWLYQKDDWEAEEDNAYESSLICGRGWVQIDFDVDENVMDEIKIVETSIPYHEVRGDPAARKKDLSDASYIMWDRWLSLEDFCVKYPKFSGKAEQAFDFGSWPKSESWALAPEAGQMNNDINDESDYSDPLDLNYYDDKKRQLRVIHMEYWRYVKTYFVYDPETRKLRRVESDWKKFQEEYKKLFPGKPLRYEVSTTKELWWLQFCGEDILVHCKSPIDYQGFSIVPCYMYSDVSRRHGYHYGIVELMKDPQREINKRTSQTLNLFNQQVQPGVYAESQAFVNNDQAEQSLKEPGSITWLRDGAINQKRFMERDIPNFPTAVLQMGEYAREMLRHVTGINPDLLGMNDKRQEPGIVVQLRQQQGMAILKPVFKAYNDMKKQLFERQIRIVMNHMPASQIIKILGEGDRYAIDENGVITDQKTGLTCNFRNVTNASYDIDVEPENNSMTANALEAATYMEMQKNGIPVDPKVIIGKTNLPVTEKVGWLEYIDNMQKAQSDATQAAQDLEVRKLEMQHEREMAKINSQHQIAMAKLDAQIDKDTLTASVKEEELKQQKKRDSQTAQLKFAQLVSQARMGRDKSKLDAVEMVINADIQKKRLILDACEILAQGRMAKDQQAIQAVLEMYKAALAAGTATRDQESKMATTLLGKLIDVGSKEKIAAMDNVYGGLDTMNKARESEIKAGTEISKEVIKGSVALESAKVQAEAAKKTSEDSVKVAEENAKAGVETAKVTGKSNVDAAKASASQDKAEAAKEKKEKPL
jgi:hypothetical protein